MKCLRPSAPPPRVSAMSRAQAYEETPHVLFASTGRAFLLDQDLTYGHEFRQKTTGLFTIDPSCLWNAHIWAWVAPVKAESHVEKHRPGSALLTAPFISSKLCCRARSISVCICLGHPLYAHATTNPGLGLVRVLFSAQIKSTSCSW